MSPGDLGDRRPGRPPRDSTWKLSRHRPSAGWSARRTMPPRVVVRADVPAPGQRLVGDPQPAIARRGRRARASCSAARSSSSTASGETDEQTSTVSAPSCSITSNLRSARRRLRASTSGRHGLEVAERLVEVDGQAEVGARAPRSRAGDHGEAIRSFSKISTPSKPAAAAAVSLSSSVPDRQTVAIARRVSVDIRRPPFSRRRTCQEVEVAQHPPAVGFGAGEQPPRSGSPSPGSRPASRRRSPVRTARTGWASRSSRPRCAW